jgi:putative ABC transport system permease protein
MIRLILVSAIRSLLKYRHLSMINILGLVAGLTSFLFIAHYLVYEFSFDSFIPENERVYRVNLKIEKDGNIIFNGAKTPRALYFAIKNELPEVEANGLAYFEKCLVTYRDTKIANQDFLWVDDGFEKVFPLEMIAGKADYSRPGVGLISETSAKALFGNENPVGKIMGVNQGMPIEITGIFRDLPSNTHLTARYFASVNTWVEMGAISELGDWHWNGWWNYIRIREGIHAELTLQKINSFTARYKTFLEDDDRKAHYSLQPLKDLHFINGLEGEMGAVTNYSSLINLIALALVTLFIAWINYVNLATAHAQTRSVQISIRKLLGATSTHLWYQSLAESILLNFVAVVISCAIYFSLLGIFSTAFYIPVLQADIPGVYIFILSFLVITAGILFSSIYHGIVLGKAGMLQKKKGPPVGIYKNGLVMVQMALSIVFFICTAMVFRQISFMKNQDLGIDLSGVIVCTGPASTHADPFKQQRYENFRSEVLDHAGYHSMAFKLYVPGQEPGTGFREVYNPSQGVTPDIRFFYNNAGAEFIEVFQMKILAGRGFSEDNRQNVNKVVINESSMAALGFESPEHSVGQRVYRRSGNDVPLEIIGVVADFHNEGLQKPIYPIFWHNQYPPEFGYFALRVGPGRPQDYVARLNEVWDRHYPDDTFDFVIAETLFNGQYISESRFGKFYLWLTFLSIAIATIGLYGLILFFLNNKIKEIGIRKVHGAGVSDIVMMFYLNLVKWVSIAFLFAAPVSWFLMNNWLQNFAYRATQSPWIFVAAGLITLCIALAATSWQMWNTAKRNPVDSLRYE